MHGERVVLSGLPAPLVVPGGPVLGAAPRSLAVMLMDTPLLVASADDAARTLAVDVAGNEHSFVRMMNAEAAAAGLDATRYANPDGLDRRAVAERPAMQLLRG